MDITDEDNVEVWILDLERETLIQLTFDEAIDNFPLWTPDSSRVVFQRGSSCGTTDLPHSEPKEPRQLDDEGAVLDERRAAQRRVALVVVDHEQLAARLILPAEPKVGAE